VLTPRRAVAGNSHRLLLLLLLPRSGSEHTEGMPVLGPCPHRKAPPQSRWWERWWERRPNSSGHDGSFGCNESAAITIKSGGPAVVDVDVAFHRRVDQLGVVLPENDVADRQDAGGRSRALTSAPGKKPEGMAHARQEVGAPGAGMPA